MSFLDMERDEIIANDGLERDLQEGSSDCMSEGLYEIDGQTPIRTEESSGDYFDRHVEQRPLINLFSPFTYVEGMSRLYGFARSLVYSERVQRFFSTFD